MRIERIWAMPNLFTFKVKPIAELLQEEKASTGWIDPFAGECSPAEVTNDDKLPAKFNMDGLEFLKQWQDQSWAGVIFDPPTRLNRRSDFTSRSTEEQQAGQSIGHVVKTRLPGLLKSAARQFVSAGIRPALENPEDLNWSECCLCATGPVTTTQLLQLKGNSDGRA